ncbi:MAG: sulfatase-like hydrolase/transferase [bacterium]
MKLFSYRSVRYVVSFGILCLLLLSLCRVVFFIHYYHLFSSCTTAEILTGFVQGVRFDIAALIMVSGIFFFMLVIPGLARYTAAVKTVGIMHLISFIFVLIWQVIDIQYYAYVNRRISYEIFAVLSDMPAMVLMAFSQYLGKIAIFFVLLVILSMGWIFLLKIINRHKDLQYTVKTEILIFVVFACIAAVGFRGGFQYKPLRVSYAFQNEKIILGHLALNAVFTTVQTLRRQQDKKLIAWEPFPEDTAAFQDIIDDDRSLFLNDLYPLYRKNAQNKTNAEKNYNVVILVMESWSGFLMGSLGGAYGVTKEFDALSTDGLLCTNFFAAGQRSTESIASILGSVPAFPDAAVLNSSLEQNRYDFLPKLLKQRGYATLFLHGGRRGTMGFDGFARLTGFDRHISREDFNGDNTIDDGVWGIWDEYALARLNTELREMKQPFCSLFFSLSSHDPCNLPSPEFAVFDTDTANGDFLNVLKYSDYALGMFFKQAQQEEYFNRTLFIIAADHTDGHFPDKQIFDLFRVPCLFYAPRIIQAGRFEGLSSHMDILPSLLDILGLDIPHASFGKSVFSEQEHRYVIMNNSSFFGWAEDGYLLVGNENKNFGLYRFFDDLNMNNNLLNTEQNTVQYYEQRSRLFQKYGRHLFYTNRLVPPEKNGRVEP